MLQSQIILQHFYKLLMWQILITSNTSPPLTSPFMFINDYLKITKTTSAVYKNIVK